MANSTLESDIAKLERRMIDQYDGVASSSKGVLIKLDRTITRLSDDLDDQKRETERLGKKPTPTPDSTLSHLCQVVFELNQLKEKKESAEFESNRYYQIEDETLPNRFSEMLQTQER